MRDSSEVTENSSRPIWSVKLPFSSGAARCLRQSVIELAFQFPPPYLESQRLASSAASHSSSTSRRPTRRLPRAATPGSVGLTSHRVTGVVNAEMAKLVPRKSRRSTLLQKVVATRTASAGSRAPNFQR